MQYTDARIVVRATIHYCEEILQSKKRFTRKLKDEIRDNVIYCIEVIHENGEYFLAFKNREYMELGMDCKNRIWIHDYIRYRINGPLPDKWRPAKSPTRTAGYFYCSGDQPYHDREAMKNYIACLYELLDLLNSL